MPVKPRHFLARICASLVALSCVPGHAGESDGGVVSDAPRVLRLTNGHYDFNPAAFAKVDDELKRLQRLERVHKQEPSWATPVILGLTLGVVVGVAAGWAGRSALDAALKKP